MMSISIKQALMAVFAAGLAASFCSAHAEHVNKIGVGEGRLDVIAWPGKKKKRVECSQ